MPDGKGMAVDVCHYVWMTDGVLRFFERQENIIQTHAVNFQQGNRRCIVTKIVRMGCVNLTFMVLTMIMALTQTLTL
jgi:RNase adaptor protein for sRNA GlmZ degradation